MFILLKFMLFCYNSWWCVEKANILFVTLWVVCVICLINVTQCELWWFWLPFGAILIGYKKAREILKNMNVNNSLFKFIVNKLVLTQSAFCVYVSVFSDVFDFHASLLHSTSEFDKRRCYGRKFRKAARSKIYQCGGSL